MFLKNVRSTSPNLWSTSTRGYAQLPPFNYTPPKYEGPSKAEVLQKRKTYLNPGIFLVYKDPIMITDAKMQYMFDETGKRYLDLFGGITTISAGHCHPEFVKAAKDQLDKVSHTTTIYLNNQIAEYAEELAAKFPDPLKVVYFVNSGSEANDLALLMARMHTGNYDFISLRNGYHGMSDTMMGVTALSTWKSPVPQGFGIHHALCPDPYRGPFAGQPDEVQKYVDEVESLIRFGTTGRVAGFIAEYIQGVGGSVVLPDGYLAKVHEVVRKAGGVCIADEVQTGFGRMGTHYWGFQQQGLTPDIVTMAKSIGNGFPLAAVITTKEIAATMSQRTHFNTYGGNPVSCAVGRSVLRVIEKENLQKNCLERGDQFLAGLKKLKEKHEILGDVRGKGLMLGAEFVKDRKTKAPATPELLEVFERCKDNGVLFGKGGVYGNALRIKPPMCINSQDVDFALEVLDDALGKL